MFHLVQEEAATGADGEVSKEAKEAKEGMYFAEADAAAAAVAVARTEAHESVHHKDEEAGGTGAIDDKSSTRERRALLQKFVLEHGVGGLGKKVRRQILKLHIWTDFSFSVYLTDGRCG